jgi:hypothetical protein
MIQTIMIRDSAEEKQRTLENGQAWRSSNEGTFELQKN